MAGRRRAPPGRRDGLLRLDQLRAAGPAADPVLWSVLPHTRCYVLPGRKTASQRDESAAPRPKAALAAFPARLSVRSPSLRGWPMKAAIQPIQPFKQALLILVRCLR